MKGVSLSRTLNTCKHSIHIFLSKYDWNEQRQESPCPSDKLKQDELAYMEARRCGRGSTESEDAIRTFK
jgi:hypothetical protein